MLVAIGRAIEAIPARVGDRAGRGKARRLSYLRSTTEMEDVGGADLEVFNLSTVPVPAGKVVQFRKIGGAWIADVMGA